MTCVSCGTEIPDKRLRAMPLAEFCVSCQQVKEYRAEDLDPDVLAVQTEIDPSEVYGR